MHNVYLKASHEVNTGLNGILGSVTVLKDFGQDLDDESRDELLGAIKKSVLRIKRIFDNNRWLELIMSQKLGDPKSYFEKGTSLGVCIDKVLHDFEINDQINSQKLRFDKDVHDLNLNLPCEILQKILLEILDNAIKFSSKGGCIALKTRENSDSWLLEISDNSGGIQLESHDINLLFNQPNREMLEQQGMGLGLFIAVQLLKFLKLRYELITRPDFEGTKWIIYLPKEEIQ